MHRLVIVAGPNRGSSFSLVEGENSIGRQMDNHIVLSSSKVSKRHCALLVTPNDVFLRDEGSTNGTFVNGAMTKKQPLRAGDKLSVGEFVLELVNATSGQPSIASNVIPFQGGLMQTADAMGGMAPMAAVANPAAAPSQFQNMEPEVVMPEDLPGKVKFFFEGKVMPNFYGMLMKTEYRMIVAGVVGVMAALSVVGAMMPTLDLAEQSIKKEAAIRAKVLCREVADRYLPLIAGHAESQIDLSLLEAEESVKLVAITNPDLQIIAPQSRLNQILAGGKEAQFAMAMAKEFREGREKGAGGILGETLAIWIEPIKTSDPRQMKSIVAGLAVVAIDFSGNMISGGGTGVAYGTAAIVAGLAAFLAYWILMRLTFKPFEVLNDDLDQVLRGEIGKVTQEFKIEELQGLWSNINAAVQRLPKGGGGGEVDTADVTINWDNEFAAIRAIAEAAGFGFMGFDSNLIVAAMNPQFEEIAGIRMDALGQALSIVARDQSFILLVTDLKERVGSSPSRSALDECEFSGVLYQVVATGAGPATEQGFSVIFKKKD